MTPQELRNSILQLAFQGKLVEQRFEEGTGGDSFQLVQKEKERLIETGIIKPPKAVSEITEEEISFEIPDNWIWVRLGNLLHVIGGVSYDKKDLTNVGYRILRGGNIQNMRILLEDDDIFLPEKYKDKEKIINKGDILIVASTGSKAVIGKAGYVDRLIPNTMIGAFLRICRPYHLLTADYLRYLFESNYYRQHIRESAQGTNINNVKASYITEFAIPFPPLNEQKRIVARIEELMPLVDQYEQAWNRLEELNKRFPTDLQKSILQYAIQGKLVPQYPEEGTGEELYQEIQKEKQALIKAEKIKKTKNLPKVTDDEIPFDVPESWMWTKLGAIVSVFGGKRIPAGRRLTTENTGYVYIRVSDMKNGSVLTGNLMYVPNDIYPLISKYTINKEDVYITVAGTIGAVGKIPPVLDGANLTENADKLVFSIIDQNWLVKCLESPFIQNQIADATTKVGQPKLAIKRIQELLVPFPPFAEQKRIVAKIEELFPLCEALR